MKKLFVFAGFIFIFLFITDVSAQTVLPPKPEIDRGYDEKSIKYRSNELERVKREAEKSPPRAAEPVPAAKFLEIKKDFEKIQNLQNAIIKIYTTGEKIDYEKIAEASSEMNKTSIRLKSNLFAENAESNAGKSRQKNEKNKAKDVKSLIVELDDFIGKFVSSPIFQNIKIVDPGDSLKAEENLENIVKTSSLLAVEAEKMRSHGNR
jgi:hypothetical protein